MANIIATSGNLDSYSTDEQAVGTWIDGSTVYRKCFTFTAVGNKTVTTIAHGISKMPKIISYGGNFTSSTYAGNFFLLPLTHPDSPGMAGIVSINATNISLYIGAYYGTVTGVFWIDFVKE